MPRGCMPSKHFQARLLEVTTLVVSGRRSIASEMVTASQGAQGAKCEGSQCFRGGLQAVR